MAKTDIDLSDLQQQIRNMESGSKPDPLTSARHTVVAMLGRREHAASEIRQKLSQRGYTDEVIDEVLQWCLDNDLQSEQRYVEIYVRQRAARRYGPLRIRMELQSKGIDDYLISDQLNTTDIDWIEHTIAALQRRGDDLGDYNERAKATQAMLRRGFTHEHIQSAVAAILK